MFSEIIQARFYFQYLVTRLNDLKWEVIWKYFMIQISYFFFVFFLSIDNAKIHVLCIFCNINYPGSKQYCIKDLWNITLVRELFKQQLYTSNINAIEIDYSFNLHIQIKLFILTDREMIGITLKFLYSLIAQILQCDLFFKARPI